MTFYTAFAGRHATSVLVADNSQADGTNYNEVPSSDQLVVTDEQLRERVPL